MRRLRVGVDWLYRHDRFHGGEHAGLQRFYFASHERSRRSSFDREPVLYERRCAICGVGRLESDQFGLPSDLQGDTIDFIRREIFTNTLTPQPGNRFESDVDVSWEIWGTG